MKGTIHTDAYKSLDIMCICSKNAILQAVKIFPKSLILDSATAESFVIMEAEGEELESVGAIKLALSHSNSFLILLPSQNCQAFSCAMRYPEPESSVV